MISLTNLLMKSVPSNDILRHQITLNRISSKCNMIKAIDESTK